MKLFPHFLFEGEPAAGGAGAAPPATPPPSLGGAPAPQDWTSSFNDDQKGWVQNKGYRGPNDLVDAYRSLETFHGVPKERLLKLPEKMDDQSMGEIYDRLGRPKEAKEYDIKPLEGQELDQKFSEQARGWFHSLGLSKKQGDALAARWNEYQNGIVKSVTEAENAKISQEVEGLKKEWGKAYDQNSNIVERAAKTFGMSDQQLLGLKQALGPAGAMKFLHQVGSKLGEDTYVGPDGKQGGFGSVLTPLGAQTRIKELSKDQGFRKRLMAKDVEALAEWDRLHDQAYAQDEET